MTVKNTMSFKLRVDWSEHCSVQNRNTMFSYKFSNKLQQFEIKINS
jgi:hypothetical protein